MKVQVYYNLHKKCLSVRRKGKIIAHRSSIGLTNASFVVQEGGRQRVLREKRKNVHAYITGEWANTSKPGNSFIVCYNPYKLNSFYKKEGGTPIKRSDNVYIDGKLIFAI